MEQLQTLTFTEKEQLCMHLGKMYRKGRFQAALCFTGIVEDSEADDHDLEVASRIRLILSNMDRRHALIILNDFLEIKEGDWWKEEFSRTTYYRYKRKAMDTFLKAMYGIAA